jgi:hypothetical protein
MLLLAFTNDRSLDIELISVSFIKDIRKLENALCSVLLWKTCLGKPLTLRTNRRNGKDKRDKGGSKMMERRKGWRNGRYKRNYFIWHSEDRALWYILIIKPTRCTISQICFDKVLYMFWTDLPSIIRSLNTVYTAVGICHASSFDCLLARSEWNFIKINMRNSAYYLLYYKKMILS